MSKRNVARSIWAWLPVGILAVSTAWAEPKTNLLHQWSEGSDAAAIAKLGELYTAAGGKWEQTPVPDANPMALLLKMLEAVALPI